MIELKSMEGSDVPALSTNLCLSEVNDHRRRLRRTERGYTISRICVVLCLDRVSRQLRHVVSVFAEIPAS